MCTFTKLGLPLLAAVMLFGAQSSVAAQSTAPQDVQAADGNMLRLVATASLGSSLRLRRDRSLGQSRLAPAYVDLSGAVVLPNDGGLQHGLGITGSLGLMEDGGFYEPVKALSQVLLAPTYLLYGEIDADWLAFGHVAIPISLAGGKTWGVDVGGALAYRVLAGIGLFVEVSGVTYVGVERRLFPMVSAELGVLVDYEVLP